MGCSNGSTASSSGIGCELTQPAASSQVLAHLVQSLETHLPACLLDQQQQIAASTAATTTTTMNAANQMTNPIDVIAANYCLTCDENNADDDNKHTGTLGSNLNGSASTAAKHALNNGVSIRSSAARFLVACNPPP